MPENSMLARLDGLKIKYEEIGQQMTDPEVIADMKKLWRAGIGTFQVFQETYNRGRYAELHPANTVKGNYR